MGRIGTVQSPILVGRDGHLELAEARLADAAAGHGRTLFVAGEAGIGKSRLVGAILRKARSLGFTTAKGDIAPQDREVPGALLLDLARTMRETPGMESAGTDLLARWGSAGVPARAGRRQLVRDSVERLRSAAEGPMVLAFEDLQWADDLSLEAIAELARTIEARPILVIAAYRRDEAPDDGPLRAHRSHALTQRWAEEVRLDRLSAAQTATMVSLLLESELPAPRDVAAAIHERSDGVPLHIEELLATVRARGALDAAAVRDVGVPDSIEDSVLVRVATLTPAAQAVARAGAVLGRCFVPGVLAGVMDVPVADLEDPLQELVDQAILDPFGARDEGYHDFRHQLLRDALYRHTPPRERRRYHARAAEFGAGLEGQTEIHASLHFARAGLRDEAYRTALAGARAAVGVSAHREAFELYRRAIDNQPPDLAPLARGELLYAFTSEALALEDMSVAEPTARAAAAAFRAADAVLEAIDAMSLVLALWRRDGHPVAARIDLAQTLLAELDGFHDQSATQPLRGDIAFYLAFALADAGALDEARTAAHAAQAAARATGSLDLHLMVEGIEAIIDFAAIGPDVGRERLAAATRVAVERGLEDPILSGMRDSSLLAVRAMDYAAARDWIERGLRYGEEFEQSHCAHVMVGTSAFIDWATGAWDVAADASRQLLVDRGCRRGVSAARWALGYVALGRGDLEAARAELQVALEWAEAAGALDLILPPSWGLAEAAVIAGDFEEAVSRSEDALGRAMGTGERTLVVPFVVTGIRAYQGAGRPVDAERWLSRVSEHVAPTRTVALPALEHGRGLVALASGSPASARRSLEAAVAGWQGLGRTWESSWASLDLASCLARLNRFALAVAIAGQVQETAASLRSPALVERAAAILRQGRGRIIDVEPWHPLTTREFEVATLISQGLTNAQIADQLGIAPKTASAHVEHILAKLGASRRAEIATWASHVAGVPAGAR